MAFRELLSLRKGLMMSQEDLSFYLGVKNSLLISQWETGRRNPTEPMKRLIRYLDNINLKKARDTLVGMQKHSTKHAPIPQAHHASSRGGASARSFGLWG
ncbi:helix-turn-helix domain-containing protein [bacterium]|nr:helix-turn-helix domain-containing protein [bacterium]